MGKVLLALQVICGNRPHAHKRNTN